MLGGPGTAQRRSYAAVSGRVHSFMRAGLCQACQAEALLLWHALLQEFLAAMPELERHCGFARDNIPQVGRRLLSGRLALHLRCLAPL